VGKLVVEGQVNLVFELLMLAVQLVFEVYFRLLVVVLGLVGHLHLVYLVVVDLVVELVHCQC
jgi:hypothetical protein